VAPPAFDISERGTPNIGEIIRNTTFNYGVGSVTNILHATPSSGNAPASNLRGLGSGSTLTLMDGRRSTSQNLSVMYPQIAIARIETLTDGGSALYGTDAVGGVVNLIPRRSFEGLEVRASHNATTDGPWEESTWSMIGGADSGRTSLVGAFEYRTRATLEFMDRPEYSLGAASFSSTSNPGTWTVPIRDAAGNVISPMALSAVPDQNVGLPNASSPRSRALAAMNQIDPGCGQNNPAELRKDVVGGIPQGRNMFGTCYMEFGANFNYIAPSDSWVGAFFFDHDLSNNLSFQSEVVFARQITSDRGSPQNPGGRVAELPTVPGENPGNPFRARTSTGQLLFAEPVRDSQGNIALDQWGRPIPARDPSTNGGHSRGQSVCVDRHRPERGHRLQRRRSRGQLASSGLPAAPAEPQQLGRIGPWRR
jgi:iron complex outermembrane recepter protein